MTELATLAAVLPVVREILALLWAILPRTITELLLWQFVYLPALLAVLYPIAIQYERGGWWKLLMPVIAVALVIDVWLNWTTFSFYLWSAPAKREYTFSQHLERLVFSPGLRGIVARAIARYTNRFDPTPPHIALP